MTFIHIVQKRKHTMNINRKTATGEAGKPANTNRQTVIKENKMKVTASTLMRMAGISAILAGVCFIVIGIFHPVNIPSSVTTDTWAIVHYFATALGFFGLFGMAGLYARQSEKAGWLGLAGFILFSAWMTLVCGFSFVEAFILPRLATESPAFVQGILGMFNSVPSAINLGVLPTLWNISGPMYILGPLLFGIATFRARVLPRWAGALLVLGAVLIPVGALVPPEWQPKIMLPVGLAFVWLGYALFSERRAPASEPLPVKISPVPVQTGAD
jgi:hypothetical protein